jgi:hypothetical protein
VERSWATPGLSHAFEDLSTDTIAWLASSNYHDTLMVRQGNEDAEELWNCEDWAASEGMAYGICGSNSLFWNEATNSYTLSLWSHEGVGEWDADTGEMTWFSAPADHRGYTLAPQSPVWLWQHEVQLLAPDRLLLSSGVDEHWDGTFGATAAYEYAIDHQAETIDLVWSNVSDGDFVADYKGGAYRLAGGNTLHTYGNSGGVREYTTDGVVVWQARFVSPNECWIGRASWLNDLYAFVP